FVKEDVLMAHHHHRHVTAEHPADLGGAVAGGIDDLFTAYFALFGRDHPFIVLTTNPGNGAEANDLCSEIASSLGECLRELRGVDVAVIRVVKSSNEVMRFEERIPAADLFGADDVNMHALVAAHALGALKLAHPLLAVSQAQ